jgi:YegS/Rv2252/BmrU family lipid kinase
MSELTVVLNPTAGRDLGERLAPRIDEWFRESGIDFEMAVTNAPGHATVLALDAASQGSGVVVAVGGDGTANEVLNGLMQAGGGAGGTALGLLPIGTGNDFAFGAGVPLDLRAAFEAVARGHTKLLDVGLMRADNEEPRFFGNGVGMGFDAVANIESRKVTRLRGDLVYLVAVLRTLAFYYKAPHTTLEIDGRVLSQPSLMVSLMNGPRVGGGFYITPDADMADGLLDLCVAAKVSRFKMVRFVPRFMRGTHVTDKDIAMGRARKVTVVSESPWAAHVDGEIYGVGARRYQVELLPGSLPLIC